MNHKDNPENTFFIKYFENTLKTLEDMQKESHRDVLRAEERARNEAKVRITRTTQKTRTIPGRCVTTMFRLIFSTKKVYVTKIYYHSNTFSGMFFYKKTLA